MRGRLRLIGDWRLEIGDLKIGSTPLFSGLWVYRLSSSPFHQQADQQQQGQQVNQQQQSQHFAGEGQTAQQQYAYNAGQRNAVMPDDYKTMSILMIVFGVIACCCCGVNPIFLIFGIVALSAGNKVLPYFAAGNMVMAEQKSQEAKKMLIWGAIGGSVWLLVYYLVYFLIIMKSQDMDAIMKFYENLLKEMA